MACPEAEIELADNGGCIVRMYLPTYDEYEDDSPIPAEVYDDDYSVSKRYVFGTLEDGLAFISKNLPKAMSKQDALDKEASAGLAAAMERFGS